MFSLTFDGKKLFDVKDTTFTEAGKVGEVMPATHTTPTASAVSLLVVHR
jgi:hypothetical protein